MTSENQSCLRFSVEESVWFQKGQEVLELLSISLDPDIVIQEHDQYVTIQGALQLAGEYRIAENVDQFDQQDVVTGRFVNYVETREDGLSELIHRFPIDITIPRDRVIDLNELYVAIESFDYEIPTRNSLTVIADIAITGISQSKEAQVREEKQQEDYEKVVTTHPSFRTEEVENQEERIEELPSEIDPVTDEIEEEPIQVEEPLTNIETRLEEPNLEETQTEQVIASFPQNEVEMDTTTETEAREEENEETSSIAELEEAPVEAEAEDLVEADAPVGRNDEDQEEDAVEPFELLYRHKSDDEEVQLEQPSNRQEEELTSLPTSANVELTEAYAYEEEEQSTEDEDSDIDTFTPFEVEVRKEAYQEDIEELEVPEVKEEPVIQLGLKARSESSEKKISIGASLGNRYSPSAVKDKDEPANKGNNQSAEGSQERVRNENVLYPTKIFARDDEEDFLKMKICIVQHGDSLQSIAERYEINIQQLLRVNRLSSDTDVREGQLLYIPKK